MEVLAIHYTLEVPHQPPERVVVRLDAHTLDPADALGDELPDWTRLDFHQCSHCPLSPETHPHCPLAARLAPLVARWKETASDTAIRMTVHTQERTVIRDTVAQQAVRSLMGLLMATSGCPHTAYFKPMARYHLPASSGQETLYRAAAMYQLAQYFISRAGGTADLSFEGLRAIYHRVEVVNAHMVDRIREAISEDAMVNAIVVLDVFAKNAFVELEDHLGQLEPLFSPYLHDLRQPT
ncbi:MAG: hypothetical protein ETSY2_28625 [Candidatus Entotheonella gemina]|uniref:Uncharacterized protein n=1 Tax=Candidatus Entotheonella gemina TaxID=1429439 RepID=W4M2P6_9BACT|nr:MAG: hypothetical protein ETSY2_28625 [Candidatus Entotheonella gemina]